MTSEFLFRPVNRRQFALGATAGAATLALMPARSLFAAQATPAAAFAALGYPELKVTITDSSFEGLPTSTPAGRYLLTATNKMTKQQDNAGAVGFMSGAPLGLKAADLLHILQQAAGPASTPTAGGAPGALPLVVYQLHFAGGVYAATPSTPAQAVIDLTPGEYVVWGDDPSVPQTPTTLTVTGDFPKDVTDPQADLTATLIDFAISLEGTLTAGSHVLKVQHHGAQPHFLDIEKGPDTMTKEQVQATLAGQMSGTPAPAGLSENDLQSVFYSPTQSIGTTTWQQVELKAGTYLAACFFPTAGTGVPHAMNGMIDVFKVTG